MMAPASCAARVISAIRKHARRSGSSRASGSGRPARSSSFAAQLVGLDQHQLEPVGPRERLGDVEVGRKVGALRDDAAARAGHPPPLCRQASRPRCRSPALSALKRFADVESATITSSGAAPIERRDLPAYARGRVIQPAVFQLLTRPPPHSALHDVLHPRGRGGRQRAQRVAIEIDHAPRHRRRARSNWPRSRASGPPHRDRIGTRRDPRSQRPQHRRGRATHRGRQDATATRSARSHRPAPRRAPGSRARACRGRAAAGGCRASCCRPGPPTARRCRPGARRAPPATRSSPGQRR